MIGKENPLKLSNYIVHAAKDYFSSIWNKVLYCLSDDELNYNIPFYNGILRESVKKRIRTFNTTFKEVCQPQSRMFVPDIHIHHQLHKLILPSSCANVLGKMVQAAFKDIEDTIWKFRQHLLCTGTLHSVDYKMQ